MPNDRLQQIRDVVPQSRQFLAEVWSELRKVHWPTRQETVAATVVVIVVVLIVSLWLGLVDGVISFLFTRFLGMQ
ncbi:MAG: secE [Deltaproteobacteria bacterium]|nr:secE [Deltaproteobacteria bacterium]